MPEESWQQTDSSRLSWRLGHLDWEKFHAVLIGIDEYPPEVGHLKGAVRDMEHMKNFLVSSFDVPNGSNLDIRQLKNKEATHDNIITEITKLKDDRKVKKNDAILIYFSGHGATMPPPEAGPGRDSNKSVGWPENSKIQCIVASDASISTENGRHFASGVVLDRTLAALLHDLADEKGSNITVILDCCHSGSGTRDASESELIRGTEFKDANGKPITVREDHEKPHWEKFIDFNRGAVVDYKYRHAGLESHVLLGACGSEEKASDGHSFTQALISYLETVTLSALSYVVLIRSIDLKNRRDQQHPICEGNGMNSVLFDVKEINVGRPTFDVVKKDGQLILCAGGMVGVTPGTEFGVYTSKIFSINSTLLGNYVVERVGATTSLLKCSKAQLESIEHDSAVASPATHSPRKFTVRVADGLMLSCVEDAIKFENREDQFGRPQLWLVDAQSLAEDFDLTLNSTNGQLVFDYPPMSKIPRLGLHRLQFSLPPDSSLIRRVLRSAAHFFEHLDRKPHVSTVTNGVEVHLCELEEGGGYEIVGGKIRREMKSKRRLAANEDGAYEVKAAKANTVLNSAPAYGIEIVNNTESPIFAWAFFFDCSTLEIRSYYEPPVSTGSAVIDPTSPAHKVGSEPIPAALNFKNGGGQLLRLQLYKEQSLDVGFLRIFLSRMYLGGGLSSIVQPPALIQNDKGEWRGLSRHSRPYDRRPLKQTTNGLDDIWDVITMPLVQCA